jgi:hypothetical protein
MSSANDVNACTSSRSFLQTPMTFCDVAIREGTREPSCSAPTGYACDAHCFGMEDTLLCNVRLLNGVPVPVYEENEDAPQLVASDEEKLQMDQEWIKMQNRVK